MPDYGIKISKDLHDVKTADLRDLDLTSGKNLFKIKSEGSWSITIPANRGDGETTIIHNLGYIPAVLVYGEDQYGSENRARLNTRWDGWLEAEISTTTLLISMFLPLGEIVGYNRTYNGYYYIFHDPI